MYFAASINVCCTISSSVESIIFTALKILSILVNAKQKKKGQEQAIVVDDNFNKFSFKLTRQVTASLFFTNYDMKATRH
ncbi:uncharacterized protein BYT42DRAFT_30777 [Radiomyces spectabilis]|uniref:uncharacterized protein n=1 Tax=Radiomyces spectabilis TaxID=64574 RepID=UPI0022205A0A|nr:uncharacterized protein BYT42DRAFT_30777 [Radiomyces spectabilis]KAI8394099.1 hypothetical protein BYT42DRAFT_30777 [Radiomyces spectabilis]